MVLVVGLAVAGIIGIAAAFYFSIRAGNGGDKRGRPAAPGRASADRRLAGRSGTAPRGRAGNAPRAANGGRAANPGRPANGSVRNYRAGGTGPNPVGDYGDPALASARGVPAGRPERPRQHGPGLQAPASAPGGASDTPADAWPGEARSAARGSREADAADAADGEARTRRRVGFRKGADVDEELWPAEAFSGVTDEQFWDDLASDKPLTTTARTARPDAGVRSRPAGNIRAGQSRRAIRPPSAGNRSTGAATQPAITAVQPASAPAQPVSAAIQPVSAAIQPASAPAQPVSAATQPSSGEAGGGRRRRGRADEEDPLTSAAFALRRSGPVDGRSALMSGQPSDPAQEQHSEPGPGSTRSGGYSSTTPYLYTAPSYRDTPAATQSPDTPPYGADFGYRASSPAAQADHLRRHHGAGSHARRDGNGRGRHSGNGHGGGDSGPQQAYVQTGRHGNGSWTGGYPQSGYPQSGYPQSGYSQGGYPGNGYRAPYDPREDYRRLTHRR